MFCLVIFSTENHIGLSCEQCDYTRPKKWYLKRHFESIHMEIRYDCEQCDYKTEKKFSLKRHVPQK